METSPSCALSFLYLIAFFSSFLIWYGFTECKVTKVDEHLESESAVTVVLPDNKEEYKKYKRNSITYTLTQTGTMVYATWTNGYMIYTINTDLPYEEVLLIIDSLEVYTK